MKIFVKMINGWKPSPIFEKSSILNVWLDSEYTLVDLSFVAKWIDFFSFLILALPTSHTESEFFRLLKEDFVCVSCKETIFVC